MRRWSAEAIADKIASLMSSLQKPPVTAGQKIIDGYGVGFLQEVQRQHPNVTAEDVQEMLDLYGM